MSRWTEVGRTFAPPIKDKDWDGATTHFLERMNFGVTTVELRSKSGRIRTVEILGDATR